MKILLTYWIVGCCLYGVVLSSAIVKCPNDVFQAKVGDLIMVAMWPTPIVGAIALPRGFEFPPRKCKAAP